MGAALTKKGQNNILVASWLNTKLGPMIAIASETALYLLGSQFQMQVWDALQKIPCRETCSYTDIALSIGRPTAFRAVAQANGANQLAIIIPCHRVINNNGDLGGYGGGITRKQWLINHEKQERHHHESGE